MGEYLNKGRLIKESVDKRESSSNLTFEPKIIVIDGGVALRAVATPECQLNFSILCTKTHTYSCMRADDFSEVFA